MKFRRCQVMFIQADERAAFRLDLLLSGGSGMDYQPCLQVWAAHLETRPSVDAAEASLLMNCSAQLWQPVEDDAADRDVILSLIERGLLVSDDPAHAAHARADAVVREGHWWPLSSVYHRHARWTGVDSVSEMERNHMVTAQDMVRRLGPPPPEAEPRQPGAVVLPRAAEDALDGLLPLRTTCRNYDQARTVPLPLLAATLQQVLMAQADVQPEPGVRFLKKNVPSAGSLHPMEAYVIARRVGGLEPGLYHYHPLAHELAPVPSQPLDLDGFTHGLLTGQHWFADAHVLVILVCRFERNFWKYRNHAKAYRAVTLDAGHISQALYTVATAQGLGAFVTAAINEAEIESVLGLEPLVQSPLAVCGFGWRAAQMHTAELDPAGRVWTTET